MFKTFLAGKCISKTNKLINKTATDLAPITCRLAASLAWLRPHQVGALERLGSSHDGGYVLPKGALDQIDGVLSFGIDRNWSLEARIRSERPEIPLHAYDPTVYERLFYREARSAWARLFTLRTPWAQVQQALKRLREFQKTFSAQGVHYRQRIFDRIQGQGDADFHLAVQRLAGCQNLLVKMDIEGDEYRVLPDLLPHARGVADRLFQP